MLAPRGPISALTQPLRPRGSPRRGRCTRSGCCSASASTRRPRSRCSFLAAGAAFGALPFYAILCLPILFAAGMSLLDTIDGAFMAFAYGWAFAKPVRKLYYNLTVTGLSVAVALGIGTIELLSALGVARDRPRRRRLRVVGLFALTWRGRARRVALRSHRAALGTRRAV